jgi:hypothetical protein
MMPPDDITSFYVSLARQARRSPTMTLTAPSFEASRVIIGLFCLRQLLACLGRADRADGPEPLSLDC